MYGVCSPSHLQPSVVVHGRACCEGIAMQCVGVGLKKANYQVLYQRLGLPDKQDALRFIVNILHDLAIQNARSKVLRAMQAF